MDIPIPERASTTVLTCVLIPYTRPKYTGVPCNDSVCSIAVAASQDGDDSTLDDSVMSGGRRDQIFNGENTVADDEGSEESHQRSRLRGTFVRSHLLPNLAMVNQLMSSRSDLRASHFTASASLVRSVIHLSAIFEAPCSDIYEVAISAVRSVNCL